jgi:hypothetical protein
MHAPRLLLLLGTVLVAALGFAPSAGAVIQSSNVTLVTKLPEAAGAISGHFTPDGKTFVVTTAKGIHTYDTTDPENPQRAGFLPLPHFENEDVDLGRIGDRDVAIVSLDPSFNLGALGVLYVIDITNRSAPAILSATPTKLPAQVRDPLGFTTAKSTNGHIANCLQGCRYVWTTGDTLGLTVYDLSDPAAPKYVKDIAMPVPKGRAGAPATEPGFTHDVFLDPKGTAWVTGEDGTFGFTTADPVNPQLVYRSDEDIQNTGGGFYGDDGSTPLDFLHHNMMRTSLNVTAKGTKRAKGSRQGSLLAITEEDYNKPTCEGQGSVQTWQISDERNSDGSTKLKLLDTWTTELNELASGTGRSPVTGNCSAHWFDEDAGLLAQGWYDQGVRFVDIRDPRAIKQVGYYATQGTFWAAYFAPTDPKRETVYGLDTAGGIDVLHFDRSSIPTAASKTKAKRIRNAEVRFRNLTGDRRAYVRSEQWGFACPLPSAVTS